MAESVKQVGEYIFPESDSLISRYGMEWERALYDRAITYCNDFSVAVDVGAHCGMNAAKMANDFKSVYAFEPIAISFCCLVMNAPGVAAFHVALGDEYGIGTIGYNYGNTGVSSFVNETNGEGTRVPVLPLDHYLLRPSLLKIDVEGMERRVLLGGEKTIRENKPVLIMEHKHNKDFFPLLEEWGAKQREIIGPDVIYSW